MATTRGEGSSRLPEPQSEILCGCNQLQRTRPGKGKKSPTRESKLEWHGQSTLTLTRDCEVLLSEYLFLA